LRARVSQHSGLSCEMLKAHLKFYDQRLANQTSKRLDECALTTALVASVPNPKAYRSGRGAVKPDLDLARTVNGSHIAGQEGSKRSPFR